MMNKKNIRARWSGFITEVKSRPWFIPLAYAIAALLFGFTVPRLVVAELPHWISTISVDAAIGIYSSVASGMIALTGIVFSLTFVMVQFSATAYSPRLVVWISRDPVISHSLGIFTATFLYALAALAWVDRSDSDRVPFVGLGVTVILLVLSVIMFISLIQRVSMLQVTRMLSFTGDQGRQVIEKLYPPLDTPPSPYSPDLIAPGCVQTLVHHGHPMAIRTIDIPALMRVATEAACAIEMSVSVGDVVLESTPMLRVFGGTGPIPEEALRSAIELGAERSFDQDPKYAIRLLVDIAVRALSPAVNDPTTAVQALNQIEDLLLRLGRRRLEIGTYRDGTGKPKFLLQYPSWEDFLRLAFDEIRFYGASSVQVMRRMKALITELLSILPEERSQALQYWQARLQSTVEQTFHDKEDILDASDEDRQGLGSSRRIA
jgi:uncharacterized membrane protein